MKARYLVIIAILLMLPVFHLHGQNIVAKLTRYEVKKNYKERFRKVVSDYVQHSLTIESNIMSEAYYDQKDPSVLWLIERWENRAELDKINVDKYFKAIQSLDKVALVQALKIFYLEDLEPLSKQQWRKTAKKEDNPLTIMLFVDSKPGTEQIFKDVYHVAMPQFRNEPGVITYQLSQLKEDSTQFVTYEKFRSDDAFQYHLKFPPIQPVIDCKQVLKNNLSRSVCTTL